MSERLSAETVVDDWRSEAWNQFRRADAWMRIAKAHRVYSRDLEKLVDLLEDALIAVPIDNDGGRFVSWLHEVVVPAQREYERVRRGFRQEWQEPTEAERVWPWTPDETAQSDGSGGAS